MVRRFFSTLVDSEDFVAAYEQRTGVFVIYSVYWDNNHTLTGSMTTAREKQIIKIKLNSAIVPESIRLILKQNNFVLQNS